MLLPRQNCLPLCVERDRQRNLELAARQHGYQLKTGAMARTRSSYKNRGVKDYTQNPPKIMVAQA
jgi:hypothetical protein